MGFGFVTTSGVIGFDVEDGLTGVTLLVAWFEGEAEVASESDDVFSVLDLGTSPRASMASRAALSFAFLALSNTSSCNNKSYMHMHIEHHKLH